MPDIVTDGTTKVSWVPTITTLASPTVAQLNAGTSLEGIMTPDGLIGFEPSTAEIDNSALDSTFDTVAPGRASYSGCALRLKKQSATSDTVYDALTRGSAGYVVIRRGTAVGTAWTASQKVEVYPAVLGEVKNLAPEKNAVQKYEVPVMVTSSPSLRATVAA